MRVVNAYAACIVEHDARKLRPMLSLAPRALTASEQKVLTQPRCLRGGDLKMPTQIIRGAIFRAFFFEDFADEELVFGPESVNYFQHVQPEQSVAWGIASLLDFAGCVVRDAPAQAVAFVASLPGEPAEATALSALMPHLGPCMHEGLQITFNKPMLRSYLSEALYWEMAAGREAQAHTASGGEQTE